MIKTIFRPTPKPFDSNKVRFGFKDAKNCFEWKFLDNGLPVGPYVHFLVDEYLAQELAKDIAQRLKSDAIAAQKRLESMEIQ